MFKQKPNSILRGFAALALLASVVAVGADANGPAPPFTLSELNGQSASLSQYKGQVVMLNFWATWHGPHQVAQKFSITTWPLYWLRLALCPLSSLSVNGGAGPLASAPTATTLASRASAAKPRRIELGFCLNMDQA